jgi:hypothetical protein
MSVFNRKFSVGDISSRGGQATVGVKNRSVTSRQIRRIIIAEDLLEDKENKSVEVIESPKKVEKEILFKSSKTMNKRESIDLSNSETATKASSVEKKTKRVNFSNKIEIVKVESYINHNNVEIPKKKNIESCKCLIF